MKIIVVGAGKVGYSLCERLVQDDHDVYLIDRSQERIHNLENTLDVSLVCGRSGGRERKWVCRKFCEGYESHSC